LAYDSRNGTLWQLNVGGADCIHEVAPATRTVTAAPICPSFGLSPRGPAYDPVRDGRCPGSRNGPRIPPLGPAGTTGRRAPTGRSVQTGLNLSGLGYNPHAGHPFVLTSEPAAAPDIVVMDQGLAPIGTIEINDGGVPLFGDFGQAGLELDCAGNLIAVDQQT